MNIKTQTRAHLHLLHALTLTALLLGCAAGVEASPNNHKASCKPVRSGPATHHHLLAFDLSETTAPLLPHMRQMASCYTSMFAVPGEQLTLFAFGYDKLGSVKEVTTMTVPEDRSTKALDSLLVSLSPGLKTRTYFEPVAQTITAKLKTIRHRPVVLVLSDGYSDGLGRRSASLPFTEIPFGSLGPRVYRASSPKGRWKVAVQGGETLDLTKLFDGRRLKRMSFASATSMSHTPIAPCLIDPPLQLDASPELVLQPHWWPWTNQWTGHVTVKVSEPCVTRLRTFAVDVVVDGQQVASLPVHDQLVGPEPSTLTVPVHIHTRPDEGRESIAGIVRLTPKASRAADQPVHITIVQPSHWAVFGWHILLGLMGITVLLAFVSALVWGQRRREQVRPEIIEIAGTSALALTQHHPVSIGGEGATLCVPGLPAGAVVHVEWQGIRGHLLLRPESRYRVRLAGIDVHGEASYRLGSVIEVTEPDSGSSHTFTIERGDAGNIGFGAAASGGSLLLGSSGDVLAGSDQVADPSDSTSFAI